MGRKTVKEATICSSIFGYLLVSFCIFVSLLQTCISPYGVSLEIEGRSIKTNSAYSVFEGGV